MDSAQQPGQSGEAPRFATSDQLPHDQAQAGRGKLSAEMLIELANRIPIKGGNFENVVYDATGLRMWASYALVD